MLIQDTPIIESDLAEYGKQLIKDISDISAFNDLIDEELHNIEIVNTPKVDNGPEFTGKVFKNWAETHGITIDYINPGSLYQNGYIERFNCIYRTEVLDLYLFNNLKQVREITEEWLTIYNTERPHEALNNMTPIEYKTLKHLE